VQDDELPALLRSEDLLCLNAELTSVLEELLYGGWFRNVPEKGT